MSVILETSLGNLECDLYVDECPRECTNFVKLCKAKYYNFCRLHSVIRNFVAQTGDADGTGGKSVWGLIGGGQSNYFARNRDNRLKHARFGTLSFVNDGSDRHGSQFFITLGDNLESLDGKHSVFGEVADCSHDVLREINMAMCDEKHVPFRDIRIRHTIILDDPFDDPPGLPVPDRSPLPTKAQLDTGRIADDESLEEFAGMTEAEVQAVMRKREAKANAQMLEMVGDIPDADVKPPENILFVCKLNAVTTDDDLKIIFSRFGRVLSCEVVRDRKSGESLQYAFVEFERQEDCEEAYFKMDNVLIDDRRIHVDFSQSVSKMQAYHLPRGWKVGNTKMKLKDDRRPKHGGNYEMVFEDGDGPGAQPGERSRDRGRDQRDARHHSRDRGGDRGRHHDHSRGGRSDRDRDRRDRDGDRSRDRDRDRDRDRGRDRRDRDGDRDRRDRDGDRSRDRDRDRDRDNGRDRRDRDRDYGGRDREQHRDRRERDSDRDRRGSGRR